MIRSMCQFLALNNDDKLMFLPKIDSNISYVINDAGDCTDNPCFYYSNAIYEMICRSISGKTDFGKLIQDIGSLLSVMIEQRAQYPFIWYLDKTTYRVSGDADRLWRILQRLSIQALHKKNWPQEFPAIPFSETGRTGIRKAGPSYGKDT